MRDRPGRRTRAVVHLVVGREGRVDHVAHEQVQHAPAAPGPPEQPLPVHQRPRVAVHMDRQTRAGAEQLPHRHLAPAQQLVLDHAAPIPVHPAADRHPDAQRPAARHPGEQPGEPLGRPGQHPARVGPFVLQLAPGHHPAAQIQQRHRRVRHGHMHPADQETGVVQVDRDMRAAHPVRAARYGGLPDQAESGEPGTVFGHRRGRQPGQPGDGAARHRPVLQHGPQDDTGAGAPPVAVSGTRNGRGEGGCRGTGHGGPSSGTGPTRLGKARRAAPARPTPGGDRWPCPGVAGRHSDAT